MDERKILVTIPFKENQKEKIKSAAGELPVEFVSAKEVTERQLSEAEIIIGNQEPGALKRAKNLKWLQLNSAGANLYCEPGILAEDVILTNATGAYDITVSENMMAYTLALFKRLPEYHENQKQHLWRDQGNVTSAWGATVVVLGLGNIGLAYARRMKAMGSYIIGVRRHIGEVPEGIDELHTMEELPECLRRADVVANILPETPETIHLLGKEQFAMMKDTAFVINAGRGSAIDTQALCDALKAGEIAGAALDVTEPEPLPKDHPLWDAPNLILTPHVAGDFHIPVTLELIADLCAENLRNYLSGQPMKNVVDRRKGY